VRRQLERLACPVPTLLDSRMMKKEWVNSAGGLLKTDFEHHGFSKTASHNIVDPAYDIAWAMLEFELSDSERRNLVGTYIRKTADESVRKRLIYYTLLSGNESMNESMQKLNMIEHYTQYQELNRTYIRSWNFMVTEASHYSASFCEGQAVKRWGTPMFVMDIDDVLDKNIFGFPSTTANGIRALSVLRAHNVCSIINTARSLEEVKDYCKHFGFAGGIAEYGSVIWDDVDKKVEILVTPSALEELTAIRSALREIPGVFVNPLYENSIRAYCFDGRRTVPVPQATIGELFSKLGIQEVTAKRSYIDTALTARSVDKGKALLRVKNLKQLNGGRVGAIGDTEADLPMLIASDKGFLVANSTVELKRKARLFGISVASSSFQSGLLECVNRFLHGDGKPCERCTSVLVRMENHSDPFWQILNIADLPPFRHLLRLFDKDILKTFQE
jgi:hydroxymethylpyrimidine pyrophosphatase-like HAD family hydrolase